MEKENYNDEIDLLEVFNNLLKSTYFFFNRWYKTLIISIFSGIIIGIGLYLKDKSTYQNTMLGYSPQVAPSLIVNVINSLQKINDEDKVSFQKLLDITEEEAFKIKEIQADTIETLKNKITTISIKIKYSDTLNLKKIGNNLINYINNNEYVAKQLELSNQRLDALISQSKKEIKKLDSLQKAILVNLTKKPALNGATLSINNDQVSNFYHKDILSLTANIQSYINSKNHMTGFEPIYEFEPAKLKGYSLVKVVAGSTGIILALVFFILLITEIRRKAIQLINKK